MAITLNKYPQKYSPAYNPIEFVFTSNFSSAPGFKFVLTLQIPGELDQVFHITPSPTGIGYFDVHRIMENYLSYDFKIDNTAHFFANTNSNKKFSILFQEITTADPTPHAPIQTADYFAFNSALSYFDFIIYDQEVFKLGTFEKRFLTNSPAIQKINLQQPFWLYYLRDVNDIADNMWFEFYNQDGTPYVSPNGYYNIFPIIDEVNHFIRFSFSPGEIPVDVYKVILYTKNSALDIQTSEKRTFLQDDRCTKYDIVKIHFLNKLGGFDMFNFIRTSKSNLSIERGGYKKIPGIIAISGDLHSHSDRGNVDTHINYSERVILNSDWITEAESIWLHELVTSPVIFQELNGKLLAINASTTSYEFMKTENQKMFNLRFEFEYSISNSRQRG